jgi:Ca-activated chloride channel family protein
VFDSNPIERVRAIAAHLAKFDYDAYDLRLMVEETIKYGIDEQRQGNPPIEGVIRDAIEASRRGEQLDPKIANWPYYRSQLTTLLAKLDNDGDRAHSSASEKDALDEEDTGPMVVGENSQQSGTDSYGQGASSKTDAALGDLTADETLPPPHRRPTPPRKVKTATMKDSEGDSGNAQDPILAFSRRNLQEVAKRDQPGRLHQMLAEDTQQQDSDENDW